MLSIEILNRPMVWGLFALLAVVAFYHGFSILGIGEGGKSTFLSEFLRKGVVYVGTMCFILFSGVIIQTGFKYLFPAFVYLVWICTFTLLGAWVKWITLKNKPKPQS